MDEYNWDRLALPKRSKKELYWQAHLYRRLAARTKNKERAMQLEAQARDCETAADALEE